MWDKRKNTMFSRGQHMNLYPTASELSSRENTRLAPPNGGPDRQFRDDTSRKRKAVDSDFGKNVYTDVSPRFLSNLSSSSRHMLPKELNSQHNVVTIDSQWKTAEMFSDHNSQTAKPNSALSQCGNYQPYNMNNSLVSLPRREEKFQEAVANSFYHKEPSFSIQTPNEGIPKLLDLRNLEHGIGSHSEASKFQLYYKQSPDLMGKTQIALGSNKSMSSYLGNNNLSRNQYPSHTLSARDLTFLGSSQSRMVNDEFNLGGRTYAQDFSRSGFVEVKNSGHMGFVEDNGISFSTTDSGQTSVTDVKETYGSYQYSSTEVRSSNFPSNAILGTHLNERDRDRDRDMLQSPVAARYSDREETCLDNGITKYTTLVSTDLGTQILGKDNGPDKEKICHSLEGTSPERDNTLAIRPVGDGLPSLTFDEHCKSIAAKIYPSNVEKLWDGSLQLNTSTTVSAVAFFKSGEKAQDINWPEHIEIKGKVRLQAFEKFIQELPRSRNRSLMVISLCWKIGASKAGLTSMKEVSKNYRESERVGFAQICPGIDLYVCPRSDTIITILAKYGFFKGMAAVEEDQDSLIGCVVWRRSPPSSNPVPQKPEKKKVTLQEQLVNSPESSIVETNSPLPRILDSESKQAIPSTRESDGALNQLISDTGSRNIENAKPKTTESKVIQTSNDLQEASSKPANNPPEMDPMDPTPYSPFYRVQLPTAHQTGSTSLQETMEHVEIPTMQIAEPRNSDLGSEPTGSVFPGPPPKPPVIEQKNNHSRKDLHSLIDFHTGPIPESNPSIPFNSLLEQAEPSATQWTNSNSQQDPTESVPKSGIPVMHTAESKKPGMDFKLTGPVFPGSPQLPPEILQRIIHSSIDAHQKTTDGMSKPGSGILHFAETEKGSMGFEPTGSMLPQAPQSLAQTQQNTADPDEDDDLPEFDFNSVCGTLEAPISTFPWPRHQSHFPEASQFNKHYPIEVIKNADGPMPPTVPTSKPAEVMQRSQASSFPEKFSTHHGITLPIKVRKDNSERNPEYQPSQSFSHPSNVKVVKGPASPRYTNSLPRKNLWDDDDDDDMPEWCPPDLEHLDQSQPSKTTKLPPPILKPKLKNTPPRSPLLAQSPAFFHQSPSQGILHGYQPGLLGPRPAGCNPSEFVQTRPVAGFAKSEIRHPMMPSQNRSLRPPINKFDIKPPADVNWRWRRP